MPYPTALTSSGPGQCTRCLRPVLWTVTVLGKRQPVDPEPHAEGLVAVYRDATGRLRSRQLTTERPAPEHAEQMHMAHAATCAAPTPRPPRRTPPRQTAGHLPRRWRR